MGLISKPIFARLVARYGIRQSAAEQMESGQVLVPITNADELVRVLKSQVISSPNATNRDDTFTVPAGKRWYLLNVCNYRTNAGTIVLNLTIDGTNYTYHYGASATSLNLPMNQPIPIKALDSVVVSTGAGTSGAIVSHIFYLEEDA